MVRPVRALLRALPFITIAAILLAGITYYVLSTYPFWKVTP